MLYDENNILQSNLFLAQASNNKVEYPSEILFCYKP